MTLTTIQNVSAATAIKTKRPTRVRVVGYAAFAACAIGYAGFLAVIIALKTGVLGTAAALAIGGVFAVVGEVGLWVGAACLGLGLYTRRKEKIARFFASVRAALKR